ncbi:MAG: hypothetical protein IT282_13980, partial [Bacteroidetes bacterium]|nr:hypothetical protein [Bacteroidota bacterium]
MKVHTAGNVQRVVTNGILPNTYAGPVCQYPPGAALENSAVNSPILEIAAKVTDADSTRYLYTQWWDRGTEPWDTIWVVRNFDSLDIPFWNSYRGMTDEDFVYRCRNGSPHTVRVYPSSVSDAVPLSIPPLYVGMHVSNMTWSIPPLNDIILTRYRIFAERTGLSNVFVSLYFRGGIGLAADPRWRDQDDRTMYFSEEHLSIVSDGGPLDGVESKNRVGYKLFPPAGISPAGLRWTTKDDFSRQTAIRGVETADQYCAVMYSLLSSNVHMSGNPEGSNWISVGPFSLLLGDTLDFWAAEILGESTAEVINKAAFLETLSQRGFATPRPPPPPPLRIERAEKSLTLRWDAHPGDANPEEYKDPNRWDAMETPFEGYRVYKSTQSLEGPWTVVFECDIPSNGFGREFGLQHSYTETGLLNHAKYFYAVTAFSKPDTVTKLPSRESLVGKTVAAAIPGTPARPRVGEVAVVPNPYRTDIPYTGYDPPWERPTSGWPTWTESDR